MSNKSGISNEVIPTPQGGGAIQGIGELFAPDLHTGMGNFTVPIHFPLGRNDFQPELNLVYSTGNGNGPFGLGWNLSVPGVSRKTSKGSPQYRDGSSDLSEWDTFVLSGAEDLFPVAAWVYIGTGQDIGTGQEKLVRKANPTTKELANAPVVQFRPRTEGLFARIRYHCEGRSDYWEVQSKDGLISYYGTPLPEEANAGGQDPTVVANPGPSSNIFSWKLTAMRDPFGNRIVYEYERDRPEREARRWDQLNLKEIRYVDYGRDTEDLAFLISVTFDYQDRPDPFSNHRAGFEIRAHAEEDRLFKTYDLTYLDQRSDLDNLEDWLPLNGVFLLSQIEVVGRDGNEQQALPPLEFGHTRFREDLYFRLRHFLIYTPSLADHLDDIPRMARFFWKDITDNNFNPLPPEIMEELKAYPWPGNVRELKEVLSTLHVLFGDGPFERKHLRVILQLETSTAAPLPHADAEDEPAQHRMGCLRHLRRADELICACKVALRPVSQDTDLDDDTLAELRTALTRYLREMDVLCRNPVLFHSERTFSVIYRLKGRLMEALEILETKPQEIRRFWRQELRATFREALSALFQEIERILDEG